MTLPTFDSYLASCRQQLSAAGHKTVVIGNEAADLDSMASSLAYSFLLASQNSDPQQQIIPLMPIPRADFKLRTEAVYVFNKAGINLKELLFIDEVTLADLLAGNGQLVLIDHNKLSTQLDYTEQVTAIIDHHVDEQLYPQASPRLIELVGSTATLVSQEIHRLDSSILDKKLATLLLGTILLDTVNLAEDAGRVTPADQQAAELLLPVSAVEQDHYFERIQQEKFNVGGLSSYDLLRKDYKQYQFGKIACGIGSVLMPVQQWLGQDPLLAKACLDFCVERNLDILLAMNAYTEPQFSRDLVVYAINSEVHARLLKELEAKGLELSTIAPANDEEPSLGTISYHQQGNLAISRKKLQPLLADYFS